MSKYATFDLFQSNGLVIGVIGIAASCYRISVNRYDPMHYQHTAALENDHIANLIAVFRFDQDQFVGHNGRFHTAGHDHRTTIAKRHRQYISGQAPGIPVIELDTHHQADNDQHSYSQNS